MNRNGTFVTAFSTKPMTCFLCGVEVPPRTVHSCSQRAVHGVVVEDAKPKRKRKLPKRATDRA